MNIRYMNRRTLHKMYSKKIFQVKKNVNGIPCKESSKQAAADPRSFVSVCVRVRLYRKAKERDRRFTAVGAPEQPRGVSAGSGNIP